MTHPFADIAAAAAVVAAVGAGTVLVLPRPKPEPAQTVVLDITDPGIVVAEPQPAKSDAERVAALEREVSLIGTEQKALAEDLRAAVQERSARKKGREGRPR